MNICLLTQDGMTKIVSVPKDHGDFYEECFIRWDIKRAKAWTKVSEGIEFENVERRIFKRCLELTSGLLVFTEVPNL